MAKGKPVSKIEIISERKSLSVHQPWLRGGGEIVEVDVCTRCSAMVFDPTDHWEWHRKQEGQ